MPVIRPLNASADNVRVLITTSLFINVVIVPLLLYIIVYLAFPGPKKGREKSQGPAKTQAADQKPSNSAGDGGGAETLEDCPPAAAVPRDLTLEEAREVIAAHPRLEYLVAKCRDVEVLPKPEGPCIHELRPAVDDPRRRQDEPGSIVLMDLDCNKCGMVVYGRSGPAGKQLQGADLDVLIASNKANYFRMGPPFVRKMMSLSTIAVDSYPRYLYNIFVIDRSEYEEMERFIYPLFPRRFLDEEYYMLTCLFESLPRFDEYFQRIKLMKKEAPGNNRYDYCWNRLWKFCELQRLFAFYEKYGRYVDNFKLEASHLSRLPLQGLLLQYMRCDLTEEMRTKILYWFKLGSFAVLRIGNIDEVDKAGAAVYPMNCMLKLRREHAFPQMTDEETVKVATVLGGEDARLERDWEIVL